MSRYSTDTCLIHLSDFVKFQMDEGHFVGMVLLDLQKAFDTVDHTILLMKLEALCLSQDITRWFQSYLSDRQQLVDVSLSGILSSYSKITCGVPQGSIIGPLSILAHLSRRLTSELIGYPWSVVHPSSVHIIKHLLL